MMTLFVAILVANSLTFVVTVVVAVRNPIFPYKLISGVALCATLLALHQVVTGQGNPFSLISTSLLIIMIACSRNV